MTTYKLLPLSGTDQLRAYAQPWNELWQRSYSAQPTVRAEGIELWCNTFGRDKPLSAFAVEQNGVFVAALPLVRGNLRGLYPVYELPSNCWASCGDLLIDREADVPAVLDVLLDGLVADGVSLTMFDEIALESPQWRAWRNTLQRRAAGVRITGERPVGVVDILYDWEKYQASWASKYRNALKRSHRKLLQHGTVSIQRHRDLSDQQLTELMQTAFDIENRSWKGEHGSSILATPGMSEYMLAEALFVLENGYLDLWFLCLDDVPIAFEYCHLSKGICFSHKIGFDPQFRELGPGRLLKMYQLERYHEDPSCQLLDTLGFFTESKAKWATRTYEVGRIYASICGSISGLMLRGYSLAQPLIDRIRPQQELGDELTVGASRYLESTDSTAC